MIISEPLKYAPFEWLDHVQREGLVFARPILDELGISPVQQNRADSEEIAAFLTGGRDEPSVADHLGFLQTVLGWPISRMAGAIGGPPLPDLATLALPELDTVLSADMALIDPRSDNRPLLLVRTEAPGMDPDARGVLDGWEASPQQRFERLLRESGVEVGVLFCDTQLRLVYAPRGETAGWIGWPVLRSQISTVSRWLVMPMAAMEAALIPAFSMAARAVAATVDQRSAGSCSTQPGRG